MLIWIHYDEVFDFCWVIWAELVIQRLLHVQFAYTDWFVISDVNTSVNNTQKLHQGVGSGTPCSVLYIMISHEYNDIRLNRIKVT